MLIFSAAYSDVWGIFPTLGVLPSFDVDSYLDIGYSGKTKVSQFPIEKGGFVDYNKVQEPFDIKLRLVVGGDSFRIMVLLEDLEAAKNSTDLYRVITPEATYDNCAIVAYDYKRTQEKGRNLLLADVHLVEIRQVSPAYTTVALPHPKVPLAKPPAKPPLVSTASASSSLKGMTLDQVKAKQAADHTMALNVKKKLAGL